MAISTAYLKGLNMLAKIRINSLLDCYESLLTDKQRKIAAYYYREDLSLQEIAEIEHISRSAVYDSVRHCREDLEHYESVLSILCASNKRADLYDLLEENADHPDQIRKLVQKCRNTEMGGQHE